MDSDWVDYIVKRFFIGIIIIVVVVFFIGRYCGSKEKKTEQVKCDNCI